MSFRALAALCVAGCSFTTGKASGVAGSDGSGSAIDAPASGGDAKEADAKPSLDATQVLGALVVTPAAQAATELDLTGVGSLDWAHWGYLASDAFDHKGTGTMFTDVTITGGGTRTMVTGSAVTSTWSDGTPTVSATRTTSGIAVDVGAGIQLAVPADTTSHTLVLHVAGQGSRGRLDVTLSDSSATAYTNSQFTSSGDYYATYTIAFNAASTGQTLTVTWTGATGGGFVTLTSATLQ